jgi:hypothetical protein
MPQDDRPENGKSNVEQAGHVLFEQYAKIAATVEGRSPKEKHPLYGQGDKSINPGAVVQGDVNDCFFFASLAAVANSQPDLIKKAIKQNADGSYDVNFPKAIDGKPVHVPRLSDQELLDYGRETSSGVWPGVMEKAFDIYLRDHPGERDKFTEKKEEPGTLGKMWNWLTSDSQSNDVQQLGNFGRTPPVLGLLTGTEPGGRPLGPQQNPDEVAKDLTEAFGTDRKLPTVADIGKDNQIALAAGLRPAHCYTVLGYNNGVVTIRDPTGQTGLNEAGKAIKSENGVFTMSLKDFTRSFDELVVDQMRSPMTGVGIFRGNFDFKR